MIPRAATYAALILVPWLLLAATVRALWPFLVLVAGAIGGAL
jgi:hypothetical protein